ncbi:MAG: dipeptidase [Deltaproteobacteria bacterium HGW-Deltaproteobacteria-22]|nr:MAG: dipeptidase [Deltaproteobacteria bacterium HGW-Deltaproteobacteria-22]
MRTTTHFILMPLLATTLMLPLADTAEACTSFLITKGASADGSTMITYAADSHELYGELYYRPAASYPEGAMVEVKDWDSGKVLGQIKQVRQTYSVVGNMNEHALAIGETTWGGREELVNPTGIVDYGSLIWFALQRAKTARQAISVMGELVAEYGYPSSGESFSISDPEEVWIMEMIGKGPAEKGAVWVARRVPDGYVSGHANQPRIHTFPQSDPDNCVFSADVITFARKKNYFQGKDEDFSFADAYGPSTCGDARACDARVWAMYNRVAPSKKIPVDYIKCKPEADRIPLWIQPDKKLSVADVMSLMRDHFEGTELDMTQDPGAGPFKCPYRWRPMRWKSGGKMHVNERATSTQQTGFSFVSQSRAGMPGPVGGVLWFGVDDTASTVYVPMYAGITKAPHNYSVGTGTFTDFTWESAFWTFNWVSNFAYTRYSDMIVDIRKVQKELEDGFFTAQAAFEAKAIAEHAKNPAAARKMLTEYSGAAAELVWKRWQKLGQDLLMKYMDGNVRDDQGKVTHPPYPDWFYKNIADARPGHFEIPDPDEPMTDAQRRARKPAPPAKPTTDATPVTPAPAPAPCPCSKKGGCGCSVVGSRTPLTPLAVSMVLVALALVLRRRRRD